MLAPLDRKRVGFRTGRVAADALRYLPKFVGCERKPLSLRLAAQFLIPGARFLDYRAAPDFVRRKGLVKNALDLFPALRLHQISFRSVRA